MLVDVCICGMDAYYDAVVCACIYVLMMVWMHVAMLWCVHGCVCMHMHANDGMDAYCDG